MIKFWNCSPGEQLGKYVAYRAAFIPGLMSLVDLNETKGLTQVYAEISGTGLVRRASASELVPGDKVLVVDLLPTTKGQTTTVAQLANKLDGLSFRTRLYSLERVGESDVAGAGGIAARKAYKAAVLGLRSKESLFPGFPNPFGEIKWLLYALLAIAALFLTWKLISAVRAK